MNASRISLRSWLWSALLHGGLLAFLALATLPCATFESFFGGIGLPTWLNPVQCRAPLALPGPVIKATLVGPVGAPAEKAKPAKKPAKPAPAAPKPKVEVPKPPTPVPTLPPPPERPALEDQAEVVALAAEKAEQAKREQERREKQRQAELEAEQQKADELFKQLAAIKQERVDAEQDRIREQQRLQQLADLNKHADVSADVPLAPEPRTGQQGTDSGLAAQYQAALVNLITRNWLRPENVPVGVICPLHIVQIPGGQVISARVLPSCPYDEPGRRSIENAVLRAQPLPYKGFQSVFAREITLNFSVQE